MDEEAKGRRCSLPQWWDVYKFGGCGECGDWDNALKDPTNPDITMLTPQPKVHIDKVEWSEGPLIDDKLNGSNIIVCAFHWLYVSTTKDKH